MKYLIEGPHGSDVPGKRSPDGRLREYQWGREVAAMIVADLKSWGFDAELTVTEQIEPGLAERCRRVNAFCDRLGKDNVVFVSVHVNAAGHGDWMSAQGWCVYTSKGHTKSDELAECIYRAAERYFPDRKLRKDMSDGDHDWEANFYVLRNTKCPAVLVENFFMDNPEECELLLTDDCKRRCAEAIEDGLIVWSSGL